MVEVSSSCIPNRDLLLKKFVDRVKDEGLVTEEELSMLIRQEKITKVQEKILQESHYTFDPHKNGKRSLTQNERSTIKMSNPNDLSPGFLSKSVESSFKYESINIEKESHQNKTKFWEEKSKKMHRSN